jgi:hypothetical protein
VPPRQAPSQVQTFGRTTSDYIWIAGYEPYFLVERTAEAIMCGGRLDESNAGDGLGSAIAFDLVAATGGQIKLLRSELAGLLIAISWPNATEDASQRDCLGAAGHPSPFRPPAPTRVAVPPKAGSEPRQRHRADAEYDGSKATERMTEVEAIVFSPTLVRLHETLATLSSTADPAAWRQPLDAVLKGLRQAVRCLRHRRAPADRPRRSRHYLEDEKYTQRE